MAKYTYRDLADIFFQQNDVHDVELHILSNTFFEICNTEEIELHKQKIINFGKRLKKRYVECCYNKKRMYERYHEWLSKELVFEILSTNAKECRKQGRPAKKMDECSERTRRRKLHNINEEMSPVIIKDSFLHQIQPTQNKKTKIEIIEATIEASPRRTKRILKNIPTPNEDKAFTPEEAFALFLDLKLTKNQYKELRKRTNEKNSGIFPEYRDLVAVKKECLPAQTAITVTSTSAEIKLQDLLEHTAERLLNTLDSDRLKKFGNASITLISKWGCDGSSGQRQYKQCNAENSSDADLFMVSFVPLRLTTSYTGLEPSTSRATEIDIWKNEIPSSTKYCRPIKFTFRKETKDVITEEVKKIKDEIKALQPVIFTVDDQEIEVNFKMCLTMIDGKVAQALTDTKASSSCIICQKTSSQLSHPIPEDDSFKAAYEFGLSPLHARIRFMEHILKLGYDLDFGPLGETVRKNKENEEKRKQRKKQIQEKFLELGLMIDQPKQGEGNTNDGNTARRFFSDPETAASITGVDLEIIRRFNIILQVLACSRKIDAKKFGEYAKKTAILYNEKYSWRYMPSTVHKILYHGEQIIQHNMLPIGDLSEEAQEKRNKDYRFFREHNTRKISRYCTNEDLITILLCTSDPYMSNIRQKWKTNSIELDVEAKLLLEDENQGYLEEIFTKIV